MADNTSVTSAAIRFQFKAASFPDTMLLPNSLR
jgi:hypothetical protein